MVETQPPDHNYRVEYKVEHGVSKGMGGIDWDEESKETVTFSASNPLQAVLKAEEKALYFANEYLLRSDGKTRVHIIRLAYMPGNLEINILAEIEKTVPSNHPKFEDFKKQCIDGHHVTEFSLIDKIIYRSREHAGARK